MLESLAYGVLCAACALFLLDKIRIRLRLSGAKHPSLRGHAKWSRRVAKLIPYFDYGDERFFRSDAAPDPVVKRRRQAFFNLASELSRKSPASIEFSESLVDSISDVRFTNAYRVPFPFRTLVAKHLKIGQVASETSGVRIKDLDGEWSVDLSGSYGVNLFGYEFYKECLDDAFNQARKLGPVLGLYHPLIQHNVARLKRISGLDEVSFHMSGTEAVMQAVRLARYHTGRSHLVRLCGAYHGWWDGVQAGIGNQRRTEDVYTLQDLSEKTLKVLASRNDIACVLINPLQALHPNADAAGDATLVSGKRSAHFDRDAYTCWLRKIRAICSERSIVLIFDEVMSGFRLAYGGAQEYFQVQADLVTYGKTLGGGLPVGVVCGKRDLMKRFKDDQPANISFARGTFNSHPYVMAAMHAFLTKTQASEIQSLYRDCTEVWNNRARMLNHRLESAGVPVRIANMLSLWAVIYTQPGRYHWMLQYYLRAQGLNLSWVGSGRLIFSHDYSDADFEQVVDCFVRAAATMMNDGWFWTGPHLTYGFIQRQMLRDMLLARFPLFEKIFFRHPAFGYRSGASFDEVKKA